GDAAEAAAEGGQHRVRVLKPVRHRIIKPLSRNLPRPRASVDLAEQTLRHRTWSLLRPQPTSIAFTGTLRSLCRRTTRAFSTSVATVSSNRLTAVTPGPRQLI